MLCMALLPLGTAEAPAAQEPRRVMAEGSGPVSPGSPLWLVLVDPNAPSTRVLVREQFGVKKDWVQLPGLPARVGHVTTHGSELVVVIDPPDHHATQWAWFSMAREPASYRYSYGPKLGRDTRILAMAGDRRTLWALGEPAAPALLPSTRPATAPATQPAAPVLYQLKGETWIAQEAVWPADVPVGPAARFSMAIIQNRPTLAVPAEDAFVQLMQFDAGKWAKLARVKVQPNPPEHIKVLELDQRPALWIQPPAPQEGVGEIWVDGKYFALEWKSETPRPENVSVTVAGDQIRVFYQQGEQLLEQRYRLTGEREGEAIAIKPVILQGEDQMQWVTIAILAVLSVLILNTLLRRRTMPKDDEREE